VVTMNKLHRIAREMLFLRKCIEEIVEVVLEEGHRININRKRKRGRKPRDYILTETYHRVCSRAALARVCFQVLLRKTQFLRFCALGVVIYARIRTEWI